MTKLNAPFYCGVGGRDTPPDVLALMEQIAVILREQGYVLRSGHGDGADKAFERGSAGINQIWLPWQGFNYVENDGLVKTGHYHIRDNWMADKIAAANHPNWRACKDTDRKLLTRTVYNVIGPGLGIVQHETMSKFVVCWTKNGQAVGGTGQALRIADAYKIPIFNLFHANALEQLEAFLESQA